MSDEGKHEVKQFRNSSEPVYNENVLFNDLIINKLTNIDDKVADLSVTIAKHGITLENQDKVLTEIKEDIKPVKNHVDTICAITRIGSAAAVFIGAVWALVEVIVILIKGV